MKKKIFSIFCLILSLMLMLVGCSNPGDGGGAGGGGDDESLIVAEYGAKISGAEGKVIFTEMEEEVSSLMEEITALSLDKFTYSITTKIGETTTYTSVAFSKADTYLHGVNKAYNVNEYEYDTENNKFTNVLIGKTIFDEDQKHVYYQAGKGLIEANYTHSEGIDYKNNNELETYDNNYYRILTTNVNQAKEKYNQELDNLALPFLSGYMMYANQMFMTFKPVVEMGSFSADGINVEVRSKGENHIYLKYEMPMMSMNTECVFENGYLTYIKMTTPNIQNIPGMDISTYPISGAMTSEIRYYPNVCALSYPNLDAYTQRS